MEAEKDNFRVLEVLDSYYPIVDGVVEVVSNYAKSLNKKPGVDCDLLVPKYPHYQESKPYTVIYSATVSDFGYGVRLPVPDLDAKMQNYLRKQRYDLVHVHSPVTMGRFAVRYAKRHGIPCVFTMHTKFHEEINRSVPIRFLQKFALWFVLRTIKQMDYVLAVSDGAAECLRGYGYRGKIEVVRNGTDLVYPKGNFGVRIAELDKKYGLDGTDNVFLFVGRIVVVKKIQNLLRVAAELKRRGLSFKLLIVGDGDYLKELKKLAAELSVEDVVKFAGKITDREELSSYYLRSDLFLFPSTFDNSPLVCMEAAAMKLPVVAVMGSSAAEIIADGENGFVEEESIEKWADKIESAVRDKAKLAEIKENCFREIYRHWDDATDEVLKKYREFIEDYKKNRPDPTNGTPKRRRPSPKEVD